MSAPGTHRARRPVGRRLADDVQRVGDRDALEAERAQQRGRCAARATRGSRRACGRRRGRSSHTARPPRSPRGRSAARSRARRRRTCGRLSVETAAEPSPGKCLTHAAARPAARPAREGDAVGRVRSKWRAPSGPSGSSSTGARSTCTPAARSARPGGATGCERLSGAVHARGAPRGRQRRERAHLAALLVDEDERPGRTGCVRSQRRTITPPTPAGAGSPETTTSAAFSCGVICCTATASGENRPASTETKAAMGVKPRVH